MNFLPCNDVHKVSLRENDMDNYNHGFIEKIQKERTHAGTSESELKLHTWTESRAFFAMSGVLNIAIGTKTKTT